ncbi:MAG: sigma-70 family RNA polymerase sigma factor [Leptospira sp.]|nr:sigma-70 family RNA polymerase sigma factor [Leptospira sp.]
MENKLIDRIDLNFDTIISETKLLVLKTIGETLIDRFDDATEDVAQEVYFRVYKAIKKGQFRGDSKLSTWIYQIAKNESNRMNQKRIKEETKAKKYLDAGLFSEFAKDSTSDELDISVITSLLSKVPSVYHKPLSLYLAGRTMDEISSELSMKQGTVKSRLFRAKVWIRENLIGDLKHEIQ